MAAIKPLDRISNKWARVASGAGTEYAEGVKNPRRDWQDATKSANSTYKSAMQESLANDSFLKGVSNTPTKKWQDAAVSKGPARFAEGVRLAEGAYRRGFEPYREVIAGLDLPARGPKGSPQNLERVAVVANALHQKKESLR